MNDIDFFPPRSVLPPLVPIGTQTDQVESLTSYITRIASASFVSVNKLICNLILPQVAFGHTNAQKRCTFRRDLYLVNGMGQTASGWVTALHKLTGRGDLAQLTFLPLVNTLPIKLALVHRYRRWCPYCLQEMLDSGTEIYERLIWTVNPVQLCPRHLAPLETHCPMCGHQNCSELSGRRLAGFCSGCLRWLGRSRAESWNESKLGIGAYEIWVANQFASLLNHSRRGNTSEPNQTIARMIRAGVNVRCDGVSSEFARKINRKKSLICEWQRGKTIPSIQSLADISYVFHIPFESLLYGKQEAWKYSTTDRILLAPRRLKKTGFNHDWSKNERILLEILDGGHESLVSFSSVAKSLGVDRKLFRKRFPELARKVSAECGARRKELYARQAQDKASSMVDAALSVAKIILKSGKYPSRERIVAELKLRGIVAHRRHSHLIRTVQKRLAREVGNLGLKGMGSSD